MGVAEKKTRAGLAPWLAQYLRFCVVGGSGLAVDMGLLYLLADPGTLGWNLTLAKVVAAEAALLNNFFWNDRWTFREPASRHRGWRACLGRLLRFQLICLAGIGLSVLLLLTLVSWFAMNAYAANFLAIIVASLWNFGLNRRYGWRQGLPVEDEKA
jgi:dolichol-phosphate mannosyltransferase